MERPKSSTFHNFIEENKFEILETFSDLRASQPEEENYFVVRESLKLQYQLLREEIVLRDAFISHKKFLCECLKLLDSDNESIAYEAIATLSVFVLVGDRRSPKITEVLFKNKEDLIETVEEFECAEGRPEDEK